MPYCTGPARNVLPIRENPRPPHPYAGMEPNQLIDTVQRQVFWLPDRRVFPGLPIPCREQ